MTSPEGVSILCNDVEANIDAIVAEWKRLTSRPPWTTLSDADWVDHLPPLLRAMIEGVICHHGSHAARQQVVEKGVQHGAHRRACGLPLEILFEEQSELRSATWRFLTSRTNPVDRSGDIRDILRLDAAISVATLASLTGYHRPEVERSRDWETVIAGLVGDWERTSLME